MKRNVIAWMSWGLLSGQVFGSALWAQSRSDEGIEPGSVTIYRDDFGVPHIYAQREQDGFYGLGYAQAEDQLEALLRIHLWARGELAGAGVSRPGPGQEAPTKEALIASDFVQRQWMHVEEARAGFERLSPELQRNYRHYVAGVQQYMDEHPGEVPPWAPRLERWDPVAFSRASLFLAYKAGQGLTDCRRGGVQLSAAINAQLDNAAAVASNEWILAPWRTAENAMMVLSDPHGGIDGWIFYEFRMHAGALEVAGYSFGALFLLTHNRRLSWGQTTGSPDVSDCYEVTVDADNPRRYRYDGEWQTMVTREVTISVMDGESVTRTFEYTRHNGVLSPVVARDGDKAYVVSTPYMHAGGSLDEEIYRMNRAQNVSELRDAMLTLGMYPQNLMVGDADGNSLYVRSGRTPIRDPSFDWNRPVPGNTSATAWSGIHPLDDLVQIESPPQGYMQNDNIAPDVMMEDSPLTPGQYPSYIFNDTPGRQNTRGARTVEVLSRAFAFTSKDAIDLALDEKWVGTEAWRAALQRAVNSRPDETSVRSQEFRRFVQRILRFDGKAQAGSVAALNYVYWREALRSAPELVGVDLDPLKGTEEMTPVLAGVLIEGVEQAIRTMLTEHGTTDLSYGEVFRIGRGGRTWPLGGGTLLPETTIGCAYSYACVLTQRAMTFSPPDSTGHRALWLGSRALRLVIFTDPLQSFTLHNFGQSEHPDSPHYADQARLSGQRRLKPTYFEKSDLMKYVTSEVELKVAVDE